MRLKQIEPGTIFQYDGGLWHHDPDGRSGGGQVAIVEVHSGEKRRVVASAKVSLPDEQPVPVTPEDEIDEPESEEVTEIDVAVSLGSGEVVLGVEEDLEEEDQD